MVLISTTSWNILFSTTDFIFHYWFYFPLGIFQLCFPLPIWVSSTVLRLFCFLLLILFSTTYFVLLYLFFQVAICRRKVLDIWRNVFDITFFTSTYLPFYFDSVLLYGSAR